MAWADFQVAILPLMVRDSMLRQEGATGADAKAQERDVSESA